MSWNLKRPQPLTINYPQEDGSVETVIYQMQYKSPKQECDSCNAPIEPIFKAGRSAEDWFWFECDTCNEAFCDKCAKDTKEGSAAQLEMRFVECGMCGYSREFIQKMQDAKQYALPLPY